MSIVSERTFTFVSVYYKRGEWCAESYKTLRDGLYHLLEEYVDDPDERETLMQLSDDDLLDKVFDLGKDRKEGQWGYGLVGVIQSPPRKPSSVVYLEVYYKHGEWELHENWSDTLEKVKDEIREELDRERHTPEDGDDEEMSESELEDLALERSSENVDKQEGLGVVRRFHGDLIAVGEL